MTQYWPVRRTIGARRNLGIVARCSKKIRDGFPLFPAHRIRDAHHESEIQRAQYASCRQFLKRFTRRNSSADLVMAARASGFINFFSGNRGLQSWGGDTKESKQEQTAVTHAREYTPPLPPKGFAQKVHDVGLSRWSGGL